MTQTAQFACLSAAEALRLLAAQAESVLFDVRDLAAYRQGHLEGAAHLSEDRMMAWMKRLAKDTTILIYCYHGNASKVYAQIFADFRYTQVYSVDGGYEALAALQAVA